MTILDARAQLICNIGPVISGSLSDDHIQEKGLITTSGQLLLQGLHNPAVGSQVYLAYVNAAGSTLARFPKPVLRVISCYADPFTRQTTLEIGCLLSYLSGRSGPVAVGQPAIRDSRKVSASKKRHPRTVVGQTLLQLVCGELGLTLDQDVLLNNEYSPDEFADKTTSYIDLIADLLLTENAYGFIDDQERLKVKSLEGLLSGPVLSLNQFIDVQPTSGGREPAAIAVSKGTVEVIEPIEEEQVAVTESLPAAVVTEVPATPAGQPVAVNLPSISLSASWQKSESYNDGQLILEGEDKAGNSYLHIFPYTESSITVETFNEDGIAMGRQTIETKPLVAANSQYVEDYIKHNGQLPGNEYAAIQTVVYESNTYDVSYDKDTGDKIYTLSGKRQSTVKDAREVLGSLPVKDYAYTTGLSSQSIVTEIVETIYLQRTRLSLFGAIEGQKTIQNTYRNYAATQLGQVLLSKQLAEAQRPITGFTASGAPVLGKINLQPFLSQASMLTFDGSTVDIQSAPVEPEQPSYPKTAATFEAKVLQQASPADSTSVNEFVLPLVEQQPWTDGSGSAIDISPLVIQAKAEQYASIQNGLLWAYRYGRQLVTTLNVLPLNPYEPFHVSYNGVTAAFRINALSYRFDQNECLVSTDALYVGVAGGSIGGAGWLPLPYGTTTLPAAPTVTNHGPQSVANSAPITTPVNTANQATVNSLISSLPSGQVQGFSQTVAPAAVVAPYRLIPAPVATIRLRSEAKVFRGLQTEQRAALVSRIKLVGITGDACNAAIRLLSETISVPASTNQAAVLSIQSQTVSLPLFTATSATVRTAISVL